MARTPKPSGRRERSSSLRRSRATRPPKRTFLVFCEGVRTEPEYLSALRREPSIRAEAAVEIKIDMGSAGSVPMTLVAAAAEARRRATDEEAEIDEVWCIFDVEWQRNHPELREAIDLASRSDVRVAVSNPNFELWLALHFCEHARWLDNPAALKLRSAYDGACDKGLVPELYMPKRQAAADRAAALDVKHDSDGTLFPHNNPSSRMHRFLAAIEGSCPRTPMASSQTSIATASVGTWSSTATGA